MNKTLAKTIINIFAIAFILAGVIPVFLNPKIIVGGLILILFGVSILCRKAFAIYIILFMAFVAAGIGLIISGLAVSDILHRNYKFDMLVIGLLPAMLFVLIIYLFTRREFAEEFGLEKIAIIGKVNKKEVIAAGRILLVIAAIVGAVLLVCYLVTMFMAR